MDGTDLHWYFTRHGVTYGPFPLDRVIRLVETRYLVSDSLVWNAVHGGEWRPVASFAEFSEALSSARDGQVDPIGLPELKTIADVPVTLSESEEKRPSMRAVILAAWRWMVLSLFVPFRFPQWAGMAFCSWMAAVYSMVGFFDEQTLLSELQGGSPIVSSLFLSARRWAMGLLSGERSLSWMALVLFYLVMTAFIRAKGRLMFLHRLRFPADSIQAAWMTTAGRTAPLAFFHFSIDIVFCLIEILAVMHVFSALDEEIIRTGKFSSILDSVLGSPSSCRWIFLSTGMFLALTLFRSLVYHFIEPLFYRLRIPLKDALRLTGHLVLRQFPALLSFFGCLLLFRACILLATILLISLFTLIGAPLFIIVPLMLPYLVRLAFLPADYFIRSLGPRFLEAWRGFW